MDNGTLIDANIYFDEKKYATVVAVSGGYPSDYKKNLKISGFENLKMIEVFDLLGRQIRTVMVSLSNHTDVDVSSLSSGIYFLKVTDNKGFVRTGKFVKE